MLTSSLIDSVKLVVATSAGALFLAGVGVSTITFLLLAVALVSGGAATGFLAGFLLGPLAVVIASACTLRFILTR